MIKIIVMIPYDDMFQVTKSIIDDLLNSQPYCPRDYSFELIRAATSAELLELNLDADVIVARGIAAYDLQCRNYHIPVVELTTSSSDLFETLIEIKNAYGSKPVAVIGSTNMLLGMEKLASYLGLNISIYYLSGNDTEEFEQKIAYALEKGAQVIVGSQSYLPYTQKRKVPCLIIRSSRSSIANALMIAMQIGFISQQNQKRILSNQALLDYAFEGLLSLDRQHCIQAYNQSALKILGMPEGNWCIGVNIADALHFPPIISFLESKEPIAEEILDFNNTKISFRKIEISLRGEAVGNVLTFLNASQIQESAEKLREGIASKEHRAKYTFPSIIGISDAIQDAISTASAYAQTNSNIMIYGESGTGKELFSQSIHNASPRKQYPFVAVNCSAIPESLLESELFGYAPGAFTGASKNGKAGMFEMAHNGTLFLDEISEMPLSQQARLLRVLQEHEIIRLGSDKVIPINVRIIAATNRNLRQAVADGIFREDLYYRLQVLSLRLPPLRERGEDIPLLVSAFINQFCEHGHPKYSFSREAMELLTHAFWPGNIRELKNFCEQLCVLSPTEKIDAEFVQHLFRYNHIHTQEPGCSTQPDEADEDLGILLQAIRETNGNKTKAAERLGISRVTLWRRLKELGYQM